MTTSDDPWGQEAATAFEIYCNHYVPCRDRARRGGGCKRCAYLRALYESAVYRWAVR